MTDLGSCLHMSKVVTLGILVSGGIVLQFLVTTLFPSPTLKASYSHSFCFVSLSQGTNSEVFSFICNDRHVLCTITGGHC